MNETFTLSQLEKRWENVLLVSEKAVASQPAVYREIKLLAGDIVTKPLDIKDYPPTTEKLVALLKTIGGHKRESIFDFYYDRVSPSSIWHLKLLRVECKDLLDHLDALDEWRKNRRSLKVVK